MNVLTINLSDFQTMDTKMNVLSFYYDFTGLMILLIYLLIDN